MADENVVKLIIGNGEELEEENMQLACGVLGKYRPVVFCFPEFFHATSCNLHLISIEGQL